MFQGIRKLLPGHILTFERGDVVCQQLLGRADGSRCRRAGSRSEPTTSAVFARCSRSRFSCV